MLIDEHGCNATSLTLDEVAARLGVHRVTAYRMVRDGRISAVQLGRRGNALRVDERELDAWLYGLPDTGAVTTPPGARTVLAERGGVPVPGQSTSSPALAGLEDER